MTSEGDSNKVADKACPRWCFQIGKLSLIDEQKEISPASASKKRLTRSIEWHPDHYVAIKKKESGDVGLAAEREVSLDKGANATGGVISESTLDEPTEVSIFFSIIVLLHHFLGL